MGGSALTALTPSIAIATRICKNPSYKVSHKSSEMLLFRKGLQVGGATGLENKNPDAYKYALGQSTVHASAHSVALSTNLIIVFMLLHNY